MIRKSFAPAKVTPEFKSHFPLDMSLRPSQIRASAEETALMSSAAAKFQNRYSSLNLPVFIIAGAGDRIVNVDKQSRRLARDIPGSTLLILRGLGHMLHHSAPDEVMAALETHLTSYFRRRTLGRIIVRPPAVRAKKQLGPFYELVASITAERLGSVPAERWGMSLRQMGRGLALGWPAGMKRDAFRSSVPVFASDIHCCLGPCP